MLHENTFSAVVCELDPLHHGHRLLLSRAGARGRPVVCLMSGNFVQRGAPAMLDKWTRARLALSNGADLVVELPLSWACSGAERFAAGGVSLAAALGRGELYFGSEVPDAGLLMETAEALLSEEFSRALRESPPGLGFGARRQLAAEKLLGPRAGEALSRPNANLGVEYCKAILRLRAPLTPTAIKREGAGHDEAGSIDGPLSASEIRRLTLAGDPLSGLAPESTVAALESARLEGRCAQLPNLERAILSRLRSMSMEELAALPDLSEGLENRLYRASRQACSLEEAYSLTKNRRVSHARVRRLVLYAFLGLREPLPESPPYLRALGATGRGLSLLRQSSLPVVVRSSDIKRLPPEAQAVFLQEALADDLYGLASPTPQPSGRDYTDVFIIAGS